MDGSISPRPKDGARLSELYHKSTDPAIRLPLAVLLLAEGWRGGIADVIAYRLQVGL